MCSRSCSGYCRRPQLRHVRRQWQATFAARCRASGAIHGAGVGELLMRPRLRSHSVAPGSSSALCEATWPTTYALARQLDLNADACRDLTGRRSRHTAAPGRARVGRWFGAERVRPPRPSRGKSLQDRARGARGAAHAGPRSLGDWVRARRAAVHAHVRVAWNARTRALFIPSAARVRAAAGADSPDHGDGHATLA